MKLAVAFALTLSSQVALAIPKAPHDALKVNFKHNSNHTQAYDFEGIVKLSNCSGSIVAFNGMPTSAKAVVMTNGHCIEKAGGFLSPGEVWVNHPMNRGMKVFDRNFKLHNIRTTKILFATMTNTDLAFYELSESFDEIFARTNIKPFLLDSKIPFVGQNIEIISGYWDRGYTCDIDGFVYQIRESGWTWTNSIRYTAGCDTIGGTSGSPIIARGEKLVVGVNNTSNEAGEKCTMNNPCEVDTNGNVLAKKGVRYGQQTFNVYTCLTPDFNFNLARSGCSLPKP